MASQFTPKQKVEVYVECAENWFELEEAVNAEIFINKAAHLIHLVEETELIVRYKVSHSRVLDSKRKFELAAFAYYSLSL